MYDVGIHSLLSELQGATVEENYTKSYIATSELLRMGNIAIDDKKFIFAEIIITQILLSVQTALSRQGGISPLFSPKISIYALLKMGKEAANAQMDEVAAASLDSIKQIGSILISMGGKDSSIEDVIINLHIIGLLAVMHKLKLTSIDSLNSLLYIAHETHSDDNLKDLSEDAYNYFGICAANFEKYYPEEADRACDKIKLMGVNITQILHKNRINQINLMDKQNTGLAGFINDAEFTGFIDKFIERFNSN